MSSIEQALTSPNGSRLLERYFEAVTNNSEPDEELVKEMFRSFENVEAVSFGKVAFERGGI